jgi:hypothetical protein
MKKIMFNDSCGLTQAVLEGRKTMTRRVMSIDFYNGLDMKAYDDGDMECFMDRDGDFIDFRYTTKTPYQLGEVVAVAQSYRALSKAGYDAPESSAGYNNKMFVRAELMPHRIKITSIKVERLQDISNEDCLKEGIKEKPSFPHKKSRPFYFDGGKHEWDNSYTTPRQAFAALIDKVCGRGTWNNNPHVFVYEFELLKGGEQ